MEHKKLFLYAWLLLGWTRVALRLRPFKRLVASLEHHATPLPQPELPVEQAEIAEAVGDLVAKAAHYTPWKSRCLVQVLVVQHILESKGVPGQFCLGVAMPGADATPELMAAHAWVECGSIVVNGESGYQKFVAVSAFSWPAAPIPGAVAS